VHKAIENLQVITGRKFLGEGQYLIMPTSEGVGVDTFAATLSAGPAIKTAVVPCWTMSRWKALSGWPAALTPAWLKPLG